MKRIDFLGIAVGFASLIASGMSFAGQPPPGSFQPSGASAYEIDWRVAPVTRGPNAPGVAEGKARAANGVLVPVFGMIWTTQHPRILPSAGDATWPERFRLSSLPGTNSVPIGVSIGIAVDPASGDTLAVHCVALHYETLTPPGGFDVFISDGTVQPPNVRPVQEMRHMMTMPNVWNSVTLGDMVYPGGTTPGKAPYSMQFRIRRLSGV